MCPTDGFYKGMRNSFMDFTNVGLLRNNDIYFGMLLNGDLY